MHPATLRLRLADAGIPGITSRTAAIRDLLLDAPAPVVAAMLGYSSKSAENITARGGAAWKPMPPLPGPDQRHRGST
jgi:hypothetical protein